MFPHFERDTLIHFSCLTLRIWVLVSQLRRSGHHGPKQTFCERLSDPRVPSVAIGDAVDSRRELLSWYHQIHEKTTSRKARAGPVNTTALKAIFTFITQLLQKIWPWTTPPLSKVPLISRCLTSDTPLTSLTQVVGKWMLRQRRHKVLFHYTVSAIHVSTPHCTAWPCCFSITPYYLFNEGRIFMTWRL